MSFSEILPYLGIGLASILGILLLIWLLIAGSILLTTKGLPLPPSSPTTWMPPMP